MHKALDKCSFKWARWRVRQVESGTTGRQSAQHSTSRRRSETWRELIGPLLTVWVPLWGHLTAIYRAPAQQHISDIRECRSSFSRTFVCNSWSSPMEISHEQTHHLAWWFLSNKMQSTLLKQSMFSIYCTQFIWIWREIENKFIAKQLNNKQLTINGGLK